MYDELVKRLRICPDYNEGCVNCLHEHDLGCRTTTMHEAADAIEKLQNKLSLSDETGKSLCHTAHKLIDLLDEVPRWISVTEKLPKYDGSYITAFSKGEVGQNLYMTFADGSGKWYQNSEDTGPVTYWMPLPEPPNCGAEMEATDDSD